MSTFAVAGLCVLILMIVVIAAVLEYRKAFDKKSDKES